MPQYGVYYWLQLCICMVMLFPWPHMVTTYAYAHENQQGNTASMTVTEPPSPLHTSTCGQDTWHTIACTQQLLSVSIC
jgi:hypothetical protein